MNTVESEVEKRGMKPFACMSQIVYDICVSS